MSVHNRKSRSRRVRARVMLVSNRPILSMFKSNRHLYVQIFHNGCTIACASTLENGIRKLNASNNNKTAAGVIGELIAKRALEREIYCVAFDRGCCKYHGVIEAVACAARSAGLKF